MSLAVTIWSDRSGAARELSWSSRLNGPSPFNEEMSGVWIILASQVKKRRRLLPTNEEKGLFETRRGFTSAN